MGFLKTLISDAKLEIDLLENLKSRTIEQKHLYTGNGAKRFYVVGYKPRNFFKAHSDPQDEFVFLEQSYLRSNQNFTLISLGCGNGQRERNILKGLYDNKYHYTYLGVDASRDMLNLAEKHLRDIPVEKFFICSDFTAQDFIPEFKNVISKYDSKIFALLGYTLGNFRASYIISTLYNIIQSPNDALWFDIILREGVGHENDLMSFDHYKSRLSDNDWNRFVFSPLEALGVKFESGEMACDMIYEEEAGVINFRFSFVFKTNTDIEIREQVIKILGGEKVELLNIRLYDKNTLINFFKSHGFVCSNFLRKGNLGYFMLKKA